MKQITNSDEALRRVAGTFKYKADKWFDRWGFKNPGDCEDFCLLVLREIYGTKGKAVRALLAGEAHIWFVKTQSGEGHGVLEFQGRYCEVIYRKWAKDLDALHMKAKPRWRFPKALLAMKLAMGALTGGRK